MGNNRIGMVDHIADAGKMIPTPTANQDLTVAAPTRIRKAWTYRVRGYDDPGLTYGPTASKARYQALLDVRNCAQDATFADISVRRAPERDVRLPARSPIADQLTAEQTHCLLHAFGANSNNPYKAGYRDYFYTSRDDADLCALAEKGLMTPAAEDRLGKGMTYFLMTDLGKHVALSLVPEYAA